MSIAAKIETEYIKLNKKVYKNLINLHFSSAPHAMPW